MANLFADPRILNTPELLRLGAVEFHPSVPPTTLKMYKAELVSRLLVMVANAISDEGADAVCDMLIEMLGPDALMECGTMNAYQIAEAILNTSAGAALLNDLRQKWMTPTFDNASLSNDEYQISLQEWVETLAATYLDI